MSTLDSFVYYIKSNNEETKFRIVSDPVDIFTAMALRKKLNLFGKGQREYFIGYYKNGDVNKPVFEGHITRQSQEPSG